MGGVPHHVTFEEYLEMRSERDDLQSLRSELSHMAAPPAEVESGYRSASNTLYSRLQLLKSIHTSGATYGWQGEDAESYEQTAREIRRELENALKDYETAIQRAIAKAEARQEEVQCTIDQCEEGGNMAPEDLIRVQAMLAAQGVVNWWS